MQLYPVHQRKPAAAAAKLHDAPPARPQPMQSSVDATEEDRMARAYKRALREAQRWKGEYDTAKTALADLVAENASLRHRGPAHDELSHAANEQGTDELRVLRAKYNALKAHSRTQDSALTAARAAAEDARRQARELQTQVHRQAREIQTHLERQAKWQTRAEANQKELASARKQLEAVQGQAKGLQTAREQATEKLQRLKGLRTELDAAKGRLAEVKRIEAEAAAARQQAQELALSRTQLQTAQQRTRESLQRAQRDLAQSADMLSKADQVLQICACVHENTPLAQALHESRTGIADFLTAVRSPKLA